GPAFGNLAVWALPGTQSTPSAWQLQPASGEVSFLAQAPAWPWTGGDPGAHRMAPEFDCSSNANCPAAQSCILGSCVVVCRTGDDCAAPSPGTGCVLAQCTTCVSDASCPAGQLCSNGTCYPPPASGQN